MKFIKGITYTDCTDPQMPIQFTGKTREKKNGFDSITQYQFTTIKTPANKNWHHPEFIWSSGSCIN